MASLGLPDLSSGCYIQVGAFYRNSTSYYDDVHLDTTDPPVSFDTGLNATFPANMLNDTQPAGYPSGTGGTTAINRLFMLQLASVPKFTVNGNIKKSRSINGVPLYLRLSDAPQSMSADILLPQLEPTDSRYAHDWTDVQAIAFRHVYCWFLHQKWAAYGCIEDLSEAFWGEKHQEVEPVSLLFKHFYNISISGTTKTYNRYRFS